MKNALCAIRYEEENGMQIFLDCFKRKGKSFLLRGDCCYVDIFG